MHPLLLLLIGMAVVVGGILLLRLHAFLALLLGALIVALLTPESAIETFALSRGMSGPEAAELAATLAPERIAHGFGETLGDLGIIIVMASVIGSAMLESGAADRIVRGALQLVGERRAGPALAGSSFLLGIPVFFDTVFYLMVPLAKSLRLRSGRNYLLYVMAIVAGGSITHSLVPPTPGPLFVANEFGVSIATMTIGGCIVGLFCSASGYAYARWANGRWDFAPRETPEALQTLEALSRRGIHELPPLWLSLLPILLPVALITSRSFAGPAQLEFGGRAFSLLTEKNLAIILGAAIALAILVAKAPRERVKPAIQDGLNSAGSILLIIGAGGAFGQILQQTGIGAAIERMSSGTELAVLPLAFLLTTLVRTAQGSATVAMITAAAAFKGFATPAQLGFHPVYLALAVGCGSKPVMWMNDAGFWIITQMSGMTPPEGLRTLTPQLIIMGVVGLLVVMIGAAVWPMN